MWELFKDKNEYNEKNIIGFLSFALMCIFGIVDLAIVEPNGFNNLHSILSFIFKLRYWF